MEDTRKTSPDAGGEPVLDRDDPDDLQEEWSDLGELLKMKALLMEENNRYRDQVENLGQELQGVEISIAAAQAHIAANEDRRSTFDENIDKLRARREELTGEVNRVRLQTKAAQKDEQSTLVLIASLKRELTEIRTERAVISKRLEGVKAGMEQISHDRQAKLPHLKEYDEVCRELRTVLRDAQNRMEVSLKLRKKWNI